MTEPERCRRCGVVLPGDWLAICTDCHRDIVRSWTRRYIRGITTIDTKGRT